MKYIVLFLLAIILANAYGETAQTVPIPIPNRHLEDDNGLKEAAQIVGGIIYGALKSYNSIEECFNDSKNILQDFTNAYISLKAESVRGVEDGLVHIGRALLKVPDAIGHCKDVAGIINTLKNAAVKFSNPTLLTVTVGKNIVWHSVSIFKQVRSAIEAYKHQNWFSFGVNIGSIIDMVFLKNKFYRENLGSSGSEFIHGFAHGVSPSTYTDVSKCIHDVSPTVWKRLENDIKDLNWKHIERSIKDIEDIGKVFVGVLKDCKSGSAKVAQLLSKLSTAFTARHFIEAALKIVTNPLKFAQKIERTQKDFKNHKYYAAGDEIGDFVGGVLHLKAESVEEMLKETM